MQSELRENKLLLPSCYKLKMNCNLVLPTLEKDEKRLEVII
jgi:hypothetical protein